MSIFADLNLAMTKGITDMRLCDIRGRVYVECVVHLPEKFALPLSDFKKVKAEARKYMKAQGLPPRAHIRSVQIADWPRASRKRAFALDVRFPLPRDGKGWVKA